MPDYSSLLGMMGYDASSIQGLLGQYFDEPKDVWSKYLGGEFESAQKALGELPGLRRGMLGQFTSGLQERGIAAGRGIQALRAGAGFAGSGQIGQLQRTGRRGLEQEYGRGAWGIGQDIMKREAGIIGGLRGKTGSFLEMLMASGAVQPEARESRPQDPIFGRPGDLQTWPQWLENRGYNIDNLDELDPAELADLQNQFTLYTQEGG